MASTTFTDGDGRSWTIKLKYSSIERLRAAGFELAPSPVTLQQQLERIAVVPEGMYYILTAALAPELDAKQVSVESFCDSLAGQPMEDATAAFLYAVADFFPKLRPLIDAALTRIAPLLEETMAELTKQLANGSMDRQLLDALRNSPGSAPESSASTPTPSASES